MANSKATNLTGDLNFIDNCYVQTPGKLSGIYDASTREFVGSWDGKIPMRIIPDISDGKAASYGDESAMGRSIPIKTFSHGENRAISWTAHFIVCKQDDIAWNILYLRAIESLVYPKTNVSGAPYSPPPVCLLKCGHLLSGSFSGDDGGVCAVLKNYDVKFPPDVPWDPITLLPYKFSVGMSWDVVYKSDDLPGQDRIMYKGR